jgi:hypothetical protein
MLNFFFLRQCYSFNNHLVNNVFGMKHYFWYTIRLITHVTQKIIMLIKYQNSSMNLFLMLNAEFLMLNAS